MGIFRGLPDCFLRHALKTGVSKFDFRNQTSIEKESANVLKSFADSFFVSIFVLMPLEDLVNQFKRRKIIVIGDAVADQFLYGAISRVSREAPVFILRHEQTETVPGGAANAALNVAALGAGCTLLGVVGDDENGRKIVEKLRAKEVETKFLIQSEN